MSLLTNNLTFNGEQAKTGIVIPAFENPLLSGVLNVVEGIKLNQQVAFVDRIRKITKSAQACGTSQTATNKSNLTITGKTWTPKEAEILIVQCWTEITQTFLAWGLGLGYNRIDLTKATAGDDPQNYWESFIMDIAIKGMVEDVNRMAWFNDTVITDYTDSPAGTLFDSTDVDYYNLFDGLFKQIFAGVVSGKTYRYTVDENAEATFAAQLTLAAGRSRTILESLYNGIDRRAFGDTAGLEFLVTKTVWDNWLSYQEAKTNLESSKVDELTGITTSSFRGIKIVPMFDWDFNIQNDFKNTVKYTFPVHIAVLAPKKQLGLGFDVNPEANAGNVVESWFEKRTKETNLRASYTIDAQIGFDELIAIAY